jgi:hypothetical protein
VAAAGRRCDNDSGNPIVDASGNPITYYVFSSGAAPVPYGPDIAGNMQFYSPDFLKSVGGYDTSFQQQATDYNTQYKTQTDAAYAQYQQLYNQTVNTYNATFNTPNQKTPSGAYITLAQYWPTLFPGTPLPQPALPTWTMPKYAGPEYAPPTFKPATSDSDILAYYSQMAGQNGVANPFGALAQGFDSIFNPQQSGGAGNPDYGWPVAARFKFAVLRSFRCIWRRRRFPARPVAPALPSLAVMAAVFLPPRITARPRPTCSRHHLMSRC